MPSLKTNLSVLALASALSVPAFAQSDSTSGTTATTSPQATTTSVRQDNDRRDWGWLGLLGLAGLLGLRRKPDARIDTTRVAPQR